MKKLLALTLCWSALICGLVFVSASAEAGDMPPGYAVASAHPLATQAGLDILAAGGNAFDAAVAVSAALGVVEPTGSGLGGGGFFLLHRASDGLDTFVDGRETAPRKATANMYLDASGKADAQRSLVGMLASAIPAQPALLDYVARKYGSKPLADDLAPAIRYARDGFAVDARLAHAYERTWEQMSPATRAALGIDGHAPHEGDTLRQPELAHTLELIAAQGRAGFYDGETGAKLLAGVIAEGGIWTPEDFRRYKVIERAPLVTWMQAYRIVTAPPPSAGGVTLAQVFGQLEALGWHGNGDVLAKHLLVESWRRAYHDRAQYLGDPDFVDVPIYRIAAHGYALALARGIDRAHATPSSTLDAQSRALHEGDHTSHFSIVDAQGNRVAATQTINTTFGCLCMAPGTGVVLNNEMDDFSAAVDASNVYGLVGSKANAIAPGKRPLSSMTPSFVEGPRGLLVLGTPGGSRIITMVTLGILDWISGGDTNSVVGAPRFHHQYLPDEIQFEPGAFSADEQAQLTALGHTLKPLSSTYGNMHAVWWDPAHDHLEAASDPRGVGRAQVVLSAKMPAPPPSK